MYLLVFEDGTLQTSDHFNKEWCIEVGNGILDVVQWGEDGFEALDEDGSWYLVET